MILDDNTPPLMPPAEVAKLLRTSVAQLANMRHEGNSPAFIRAGRKILYTRAAIEEWLKARTHLSTSNNGGTDAKAA